MRLIFLYVSNFYVKNVNYFLYIYNGLRLKPFPHFDDLSLVFGKDSANGKWAMPVARILEELDQDEASNDIGIDDLEVDASTTASTPSWMECSS